MRFSILGPLEVVQGDSPVDLGRPKQRALLALLLVSANRVVPLDRLVELLWEGEAPPQATGAVQAYVSNLRRVLEPARPARAPARVLVTQAPGYVLHVAPDDLDASRFERLAGRGRELLDGRRPGAALGALDEALALWRGPALADVAGERFARAEAARLEARKVVAAEDRLEAQLQLGKHRTVVAELEAAVEMYPLRERPWSLLMLALYRSGRQAEALRAYAAARRRFVHELGVEPSPALRALEAEILAQSPSLDWRPPAQVVAGALASDELVGRQAELDALTAALAGAHAGRGSLVLLSGEAGIGKTRLAEELTAVAARSGARVAWARTFESEGGPPFWPWIQVVRSLLRSVAPAILGEAVAAGDELGHLVPELRRQLGPAEPAQSPPGDGAAARFRLFEAVTRLLAGAAAEQPLVVVFDDVHWADPLSVRLLVHLGTRIADAGLLVVATYRDPEGHECGPLVDALGELARLRAVHRLPLRGLTRDEVEAFMARAGADAPAPDQVAAVHARTEGNPFFVAELTRLMAAEALTDPEAVPTGVRDVVRRRLARLPEPTRTFLVTAAVAGRDFALDTVADAGRIDLDEALARIQPAVATGMVSEDGARPGRFRFSHALVRDTVYREISALRRARLHAEVGQALARLPDAGARTSELASHFFRAAAVDGPGRGLEYALAASEEALAGLAYEQAEEHLARALELVGTMPPGAERARCELRVQNRLAVVRTVAGGFTDARATAGWDRAGRLSDEVDDEAQQLASEWGLLSLSCVRGDLDVTARLGRELLQRDKVASRMAGHFGLGRAALFCGDLREALARFRHARAVCDSLDADTRLALFGWLDPAVLCRVNAGFVLALAGDDDPARRSVAEGTAVAKADGYPLSVGASLMFDAAVAVLAGAHSDAHDRGRALSALAERHGLPDFVAQAAIFCGWASSDAEAIAGGVAAKRAAGFRMWQTFDLALLADAHRRAGQTAAALLAVDDALAAVQGTGERFYLAELLRLRGELTDDPDEAVRCLGQAVAVATSQGARRSRATALAALDRVGAQGAPF